MQTQLKTNEEFSHADEYAQHDAHIKAYEAKNLGIRVTLCDSRGVPVSNTLAPISSYLPNTIYNL